VRKHHLILSIYILSFFFQTKLILHLLKVKQIPVGLRGYVETRQPNGNLLLLKPRKTEDAVKYHPLLVFSFTCHSDFVFFSLPALTRVVLRFYSILTLIKYITDIEEDLNPLCSHC
jgi:hypothetical protein